MLNKDECTILVCSCDSYEDTWYPFFKLFKKYWPDCPYEIILNTESKSYSFEDLNIHCLQKFRNRNVPYGERMIAHLKTVSTPYTLVLMDDFFLRKPVNEGELQRVINWLKNDRRAVVFSFQLVKDEMNTDSPKYKGYCKRPIYGEYKFNFQAAIWKTDYLLKSWKKHESPWEWETIANFRTFNDKYDFYCLKNTGAMPIDYGFRNSGMGVYRGKWVLETVDELFKENDIVIDYSKRGIYTLQDKNTVRMVRQAFFINEFRTLKSTGMIAYTGRLVWRLVRRIKKLIGRPVYRDWIEYKRAQQTRNTYCWRMNDNGNIKII